MLPQKKILILAIILITLLGFFVFQKKSNKENNYSKNMEIPTIGAVQVLNGCGITGAAIAMEHYLRSLGFDVKDKGNAAHWNYKETIIASRTKDPSIAKLIGKALKTDNIIMLRQKRTLFDATIIVGKDFRDLIKK